MLTLILLLSMLLTSEDIVPPTYESPPFPQPPEELPEKWQCTLKAAIVEEGPCLPVAIIQYWYAVDRAFADCYKPYKIGQDRVCLPYKREEVNLNDIWKREEICS